MSSFLHALPQTMLPLLQMMFFPALLGAGLLKFGILDRDGVDTLARVVMFLFLPVLTFSTTIANFHPWSPEYAGWYLMPLFALFSIGVVFLFARIPTDWICHSERRRPFRMMASFQNAGYVPLVILSAIYSGSPQQAAAGHRMMVLLFLYIMGQNPMLWGVGAILARRTRPEERALPLDWLTLLRQGMSPPMVATLVSVLLCLFNIPQRMPAPLFKALLDPLQALANCTVPLVMIILGAMIASLDLAKRPARREIYSLVAFRLVLLPLMTFIVLQALLSAGWIVRSWAVILFIESMPPSATNIAVMVRRYGSEEAASFVSHAMLPNYLFSLVSMPLWLTLWMVKTGFGI